MKFLIIDDDKTECLLTRQLLSDNFPNAEIIEISTRQQYEEMLGQTHFNLVITEYRLDWTDGLSLFSEIRRHDPWLPVIMLTAFGNETIAADSIKKGLTDYIVKSNREALPKAIIQSLQKPAHKIACKDEETGILWCEKWDLAISKLTSDFAYSMRISAEGEPLFEWVTEPFKRFLDHYGTLNSTPNTVGHNFGLVIHPDDLLITQSRFKNLLDGYEDTSEYRIIGKQGEIRCLSDHSLPIRDWISGGIVRVYGAIQDITWRRNAEDKLRLMQHAIDSSSNGIVITGLADTDHAIIYANNAFLDITGYSMDELLGQNCRILQKDERTQPELEKLRTALNQHSDGYAILRNYRKDGSVFWNEVYISPIRDSRNRITHFLGVQNDVTQRYEMETMLIKNETKMRAIFENVSDAIVIIDEQGLIESVNPSAEKIFGYAAREMTGKNIKLLIPEPDRKRHNAGLSGYLNSRNNIPKIKSEVNALKKDGGIFPIALGVSEIKLEQRRLFVGTIHDLTENKRAETILRTSEERYRTLFENSAQAIFVHRNGTRIEQVNQACLRLWGAQTPEELLNKQPLELFHPDYHAIIGERIKHATTNRMVQPFIEEKIIRLDGETADVLSSAIPFVDEKGPLLFVVLLDITERKRAEAALRDSKVKYQELSKHLELVREDERARIAREIHDELGSFLTVMKMDLSWLGKQLPADMAKCREKTLEMTQQIEDGIETVKRIITDLRPSILDHLGLLAAIEWQVENFRRRTGIACLLTLPDKDLMLEANRSTAIFRITQEALTNVLLHAKAKQVAIVIQFADDSLLLTIQDDGCGIAPALNNKSGGYGIHGMRERARHFGGQLSVDSRPGSGTTVKLSMPLQTAEREKNDD